MGGARAGKAKYFRLAVVESERQKERTKKKKKMNERKL